MNKHITLIRTAKRKLHHRKKGFCHIQHILSTAVENYAHGNSCTGHSPGLKVPLLVSRLTILSEICAMLYTA